MRKNSKIPNNYVVDGDITKIELRRRNKESLWAIIDTEDLQKILDYPYSWHSEYDLHTHTYYAKCTRQHIKPSTYSMHLFILGNPDTTNKKIDHINHDTLDNRKCNLRLVENSHNSKNRSSCNSNNKSGARNVALLKSGKYRVQLFVNGENINFGEYDDLEYAKELAKSKREEYYGEFAGHG